MSFGFSNVGAVPLTNRRPVLAIGGTITDITVGDRPYRVHTFTTTGTLTIQDAGTDGEIDALVVAGGGSGARGGGAAPRGGGGAGGVIEEIETEISKGSHAVTVGLGGAARSSTSNGENGQNSSIGSLITALGGGGGGGDTLAAPGLSGGSGGGGAHNTGAGGSGTAGQGFAGGAANSGGAITQRNGGGGGGSSEVGGDGSSATDPNRAFGGDGGDGLESDINGTSARYGGGGGGSVYGDDSIAGEGGLGGGGDGHLSAATVELRVPAQSGQANTGGGGGGAEFGANSGAGGSGIGIIRYPTQPLPRPLDFAPLLWFDMSDRATLFDATTGGDPSADSAAVLRINDKSGGAHHAVVDSSTSAPTVIPDAQNGLSSVRFAGNRHYVIPNFSYSKSQLSVFSIIKRNFTSGDGAFISHYDTGGSKRSWYHGMRYTSDIGTALTLSNNGTNFRFRHTLRFGPTEFMLHGARFDGNSETTTAFENLTQRTMFSSGGTAFTAPLHDATVDLLLGALFSNGSPAWRFTGDMAEILVYNNLTVSQDALIRQYLVKKWALV